MKRKNTIIIVEGKSDQIKINSFLDIPIIITNGSALSKKTLLLIEKISQDNEIIIFTDPDYQGKRIRKIISEKLNNNCKHAFIKKELAIKGKKTGVAEANINDIKNSLNNVHSNLNFESKTITWVNFIKLNIYNNKDIRFKICDYLNIERCNNKTFFKWLNILNLTEDKIKNILKEIN